MRIADCGLRIFLIGDWGLRVSIFDLGIARHANPNPQSSTPIRNRQPQSAIVNLNPQSPTSIRTRQSAKSAIAIPQSAILG
jgi:hypothetical protein